MREQFLHQTLRTTTERHPRRPAVIIAGETLTYAALWGRAGALARLLSSEFGQQSSVGLLSSRAPEAYVAYWSLVRLGWTVVPLNAGMPAPRLAAALRDADATLLLHTEEMVDVANEVVVLCPSVKSHTVAPSTATAHFDPRGGAGRRQAYTIFTSGSTGVPKGAPITHSNLAAWLPHVIDMFRTREPARVAQTCDISWDLSVLNMYLAWGTGGALLVPDDAELVAPSAYINRESVTHWFSTPQSITLMGLLDDLRPDAMETLQWSMFGGEPLRSDQADQWLRAASSSRLANVYGPTEFTCTSFNHVVPGKRSAWVTGPWDALPIGSPLPGVEHRVVGEDGQENTTGELLLRGPQRFSGYVSARDNEAAFARSTPTGVDYVDTPEETDWYRTGDLVEQGRDSSGRPVLFFVGRRDDQVKINGYRVEPGEIEMVARSCEGVEDVAAVVAGTEIGSQEIAAFFVGSPSVEAVITHLHQRLPDYMVPAQVQRCERLPLSPNGKVDRKQLRLLAHGVGYLPSL